MTLGLGIWSVAILSMFAPPSMDADQTDCDDAQPRAFADHETLGGSVVIRVYNEQLEATAEMCLLDEDRKRVFFDAVAIEAMSQAERRIWVPVGNYTAVVSLEGELGQSATHWDPFRLDSCDTRSLISSVEIHKSPVSIGIGGRGHACDQEPPHRPADVLPAPAILASRPPIGGSFADYRWNALAAASFAVALCAFPRPRYVLLALFSRVEGPAVLDQTTRHDIYTMIRQNPGLTANRIANLLTLGSGETRYHLTVLRRNRLVTEIQRGSSRCYFPAGIGSPEQLRATATLRYEAAERLYEALLVQPDASLSALAYTAGLRLSAASKALARLVAGGLAERFQNGRELRVRPTRIRPLLPLIESNPSSDTAAVP